MQAYPIFVIGTAYPLRLMALAVRRFESVADFLAAAGDYLAAREAEHNLLLGLCSTVADHPDLFGDDPPRFMAARDDAGLVEAVTVRTPPWNLVLSEVDHPEGIDAIVRALFETDEGPTLPGVTGPKEPARRLAAAWSARTGRRAMVELEERIFRLTEVVPPQPAGGRMREATERDRDLLKRWNLAFQVEAQPGTPPSVDVETVVDRWLAGIGRRIWLWEDAGETVSMVGAGGRTPNGIRIGPVYTPPERRGRGYASNLTAAVTQAELDSGCRFCFLFTDLANPTSNKIYRAIGYEPVTDVDVYRFEPA
jgi:predicted GNAT family acetyltransferase